MSSRQIGTHGVLLSRVGLGGIELGPDAGEEAGVDRAVSVIDAACGAGVSWLDTSENYGAHLRKCLVAQNSASERFEKA